VVGVRIGEQQVELASAQLRGDRLLLLRDLYLQLGVILGELVELDQVARPAFELVPGRDQLVVLRGFAREVARAVGVVPDAGLTEEPV
jgi:hypothetical protein